MQQYIPWIVTGLALIALVLLLGWQNLASHRRHAAGPSPLPAAWDLVPRPVFSVDERRMHRQLQEALPHHIVLAKLPLVRFCQPTDPNQVRYWYDLLGATHVSFAVCSVNGRVLAAIDLNYERSGPTGRATRIKQSVLGACRIRYLRCAPDHMPSIPELQLLVPQTNTASRGPQPAPAMPAYLNPAAAPRERAPMQAQSHTPPAATATSDLYRRRERSALWHESMDYKDSFFAPGGRFEVTGHGELGGATDDLRGPADGHGLHARATTAPLRH